MAFFVAAICITASEYLRLRRRRVQGALEASAHPPSQSDREAGDARLFTLAAAKAVTVLCTGLVVYLSVNAVTHPATLEMQVTHLSPWPTEGTVRVAALALCALATAARRFLGTATASLAR